MENEGQRVAGKPGDARAAAEVLEPVRAALAAANESDRYRLLASLLTELAEASANGRPRGADEVRDLSRKLQALGEEKASLLDRYAALKSDLDHHSAQLEAEQTRSHELDLLNKEQRSRLDAMKKQLGDIEAQLVTRNAELHKAHAENDKLLLQLQRTDLERERDGRSATARAETAGRGLSKEVKDIRAELEQLRADKDAEITRLTDELAKAQAAEVQAADIPLARLWRQLSSAKPPLVDGQAQPNEQCALRLVDGFVELVRFVDDFDRLIRPFLAKYTKQHQPIRVSWDVYAKRDDTRKTVQQTLATVRGKPVGVLKVRLRGLYTFANAGMIANDVTIESIASELHSFLMGPVGAGSDPNRTIKEFLRDDGNELFLQHMRELRTAKLAETLGRGG